MSRLIRYAALAMVCAAAATQSTAAVQLASRPTAEWIKLLDSPERIAGLKVDEIVSKLQLKSGDVVTDIGAGTGVFSIPLARAVRPGKVYAVEVDRGLVDHIRAKAADQKVDNVVAIFGRFTDPGLPSSDVDLAFFHDVLHHIADRPGYLAHLVKYLKPSARIAVVDMDPLKGPHRNDPSLQITRAQLQAWMADVGFKPEQQVDLSEEKWFAMYARH